MLVSGKDEFGHFELETPPEPGEPLASLRRHEHSMDVWNRSRQEQLAMRNAKPSAG